MSTDLAHPDYEPSGVTFPIAYEGHAVTHANLVLEGGAMRGLFTAGVLDVLMDRGLFCENVIGTSAGALMGYNYVAGQRGRGAYVNLKYCTDWRYLSLKSYVRTGNAFGREMSFDLIPNVYDPFPYEAFDRSPMTLTAVSSDLELGEADYHLMADARADLPYVIASASMPLVSEIVEIDGKKLLDGGSCDSVPIVRSQIMGASKHIVVCTQDASYRKSPNKLLPLVRQRYAEYPCFVERVAHRHFEYNRTYRALERMHASGEIFLIRPERPVEVSSMEQNQAKLLDLYEQGAAAAARSWSALERYLGC
ncbi:patatin family protein [Adlercreutzia sp. ZJ242]|uniref:patatin-like phospholipase family protein n=1 Tax=Adlercreutzia sp. ZJ242 TaxID=2709409 RepID=UPI0013EDF633|nr:patatin family protein [Adlercreutzia sp. ZJ242]